VADTGDGGSDGDPVDKAVGPGVSEEMGSGEVSADGRELGPIDATGDDDDGETDELAQPARRDRHTSDDARSLSIRRPFATAV